MSAYELIRSRRRTLALEISCGEGGKPRIAGGPEFSLSHSGERVLFALSDQKVGADIQQLRP